MNELKLFENDEFGLMRMVMIEKEPWFVGKDVAAALGYKDTADAISCHVDIEDKMGGQNTAPYIIDSLGRKQYPVFINESGIYSLAFSSKLESAKRFKRWVTSEVLPSIRKTGKYETPKVTTEITKTVAGAINDVGATSEAIEKLFKVEHGIALAHSISLIETAYGFDLTEVKALLPPAEKEPGQLTATSIGKQLGCAAIKVNKMLAEKGLQIKEGKDWTLTEAGREYGEMMPFTNHGHSGYRPMWRQTVVDLLKGGYQV